MNYIKYLDEHMEEVLLVILLAAMSLVIGLQVFMRYVMKASLSWSEEIARYMFIWMTYIGISYGVKKKRHIKVDIALSLFHKSIREYVLVISDLIFMAFAIVIVIKGYELDMKIFQLGQSSPALSIPMGFIYLAPVGGFLMVAIRLSQDIFKRIQSIREGVI